MEIFKSTCIFKIEHKIQHVKVYWVCVYCQKKIQSFLDMNIVWSKKQTIPEQWFFKSVLVWGSQAWLYGMAFNAKMKKLFNFYSIGFYNVGF